MRALISVSYQLVTTVQWYHASSNSMETILLANCRPRRCHCGGTERRSPMEELETRVVERLLARVATLPDDASSNSMETILLANCRPRRCHCGGTERRSPMEELETRVVERLLPRVATPVGGLIGM